MSIVLEREAPPFQEDATGAIRIGKTRVLLEIVIRAFLDGVSPETIVQQYSTLSLSDTYSAIAYYLRHQKDIETYLQQREQIASKVQQRFQELQPDMSLMRSRLSSLDKINVL
ncbi:MAG: DUF433 domain-containing protein [Pseudanabaena sp.]